jgi:AraC-like DNA-binding protein
VATIIEELRQRVQVERRLIARLKTANIRFTDAQIERIWAIASAHQAGLSIRKIAGATGLSSSRIHQLLNAPEGKEIPVWLSQLSSQQDIRRFSSSFASASTKGLSAPL